MHIPGVSADFNIHTVTWPQLVAALPVPYSIAEQECGGVANCCAKQPYSETILTFLPVQVFAYRQAQQISLCIWP
jgi:hypothetical protein